MASDCPGSSYRRHLRAPVHDSEGRAPGIAAQGRQDAGAHAVGTETETDEATVLLPGIAAQGRQDAGAHAVGTETETDEATVLLPGIAAQGRQDAGAHAVGTETDEATVLLPQETTALKRNKVTQGEGDVEDGFHVVFPLEIFKSNVSCRACMSEQTLQPPWISDVVNAFKGKKATSMLMFPKQFEAVRRKWRFKFETFISSMATAQAVSMTRSRSGSQFYFSRDGLLLVKEVSTDMNVFVRIQRDFFRHLREHEAGECLLVPIFGAFTVMQTEHFVVMPSVVPLLSRQNFRSYDLKGLSRLHVPDSDAALRNPFHLAPSSHVRFLSSLGTDLLFLEDIGATDYSLLVHHVEEGSFLFIGLVDYLGQYTWKTACYNMQRRLRIVARRVLDIAIRVKGANRVREPTVVDPTCYANRMSKAFREYFLSESVPSWLHLLLQSLEHGSTSVDILFADEFRQLRNRRNFPRDQYINSLRTARWKYMPSSRSGARFCATMDGRIIVKEVPDRDASHLTTFVRINKEYFNHIRQHGAQCLMSSILGIYKVKDRWHSEEYHVIVLESTAPALGSFKHYDLKGLVLYHVPESDASLERQIPLSPKSHATLFKALAHDTQFFETHNLTDYSLLVFEAPGRLTVSLIDYLQTYTWDKVVSHLKMSLRIFLRGSLDAVLLKLRMISQEKARRHMKEDLVIHPSPYRKRFVGAMAHYFPRAGPKKTT